MTGYGEARYEGDALRVSMELRAVNNRYLKVSVRAGEPYNLLEPEFEKVVRRSVRRGTVQIHLRVERQFAPGDFRINATALTSYVTQLRNLSQELGLRDRGESLLYHVLTLPGVAPEPGNAAFNIEEEWPLFEKVLEQALAKLQTMRQEEGRAMAQELLQLRDVISGHLDRIRRRSPEIVESFRDRILERVRGLLAEIDIEVDKSDLIKEVSVFAERSDISEEIVRLASHLDQFQEFMNEQESTGRKLEFLVQEMSREANTIGSKASDVEISRHVVEIKGALEKIRELVQNIE
jgi:uncharacterized protein (TIGR00255 family)